MKKQHKIFRFLFKTSCILFLMSCLCSMVNAQSKLFTVSLTNDTGGDLVYTGYHGHRDFHLIKYLPAGTWKKGETKVIAFEIEVGPAAHAAFYALEGELVTLNYTYSNDVLLNGGPYPLSFSFKPGRTVEETSLMIYDPGRKSEVDVVDVCEGGNKNGLPFFCVANNLPVSIRYGSPAYGFLVYDKNPNAIYPAPRIEGSSEEDIPLALVEMQMLAKDDPTVGIMTLSLPFPAPVTVLKTDIPDIPNRTTYARSWFFDPNTKRIHNGSYGYYFDYCLGLPNIIKNHPNEKVLFTYCDSLAVVEWTLGSNGDIQNHGFCITRVPNTQTGETELWRKECKDLPEQKWIQKAFLPESTKTIHSADNSLQNKCIDNYDNQYEENQDALQLADCGNDLTQSWIFNDNFQILSAVQPRYCAGHPEHLIKNATIIPLHICENIDADKWIFDGVSNMIRNYGYLNKCAAIGGEDQIKLYDCDPGKMSHQWGIEDDRSNVGKKRVASIRPYIHQNVCIDNYAGKTDNHNKIQIWNCSSSNNNQKWFFDSYDYTIRLSNHRDKCLYLPSENNGTDLELYQCNGSSHQQWIYDEVKNVIRSKRFLNKCIDLTNGLSTNGTVVQIWDCKPDVTNMLWTLEESEPNPVDEVFGAINRVDEPDKCIDLAYTNISNGANIHLVDCKNNVAQTWFVQGQHIKLAARPEYCLAINGGDKTNIHLWDCKDQDNEEWIFDVPFQFIRSKVDPNTCLAVNGTNIEIAKCNYDPSIRTNMTWNLPGGYSEILSGDNLSIHLNKKDEMCVTMKSIGDEIDGFNLQVNECHSGYNTQKFLFDGSRIKLQTNTDLCVDLEDANTTNGSNIRMLKCTGSIFSQKWMYDGISKNFRSKLDPNKCIDFNRGSTAEGTNIQIWNCNDSDAQQFIIK